MDWLKTKVRVDKTHHAGTTSIAPVQTAMHGGCWLRMTERR